MGILSLFKRRQHQNGRTAETAFILPRVPTHRAVNIEYLTLEKMFGTQNTNWRLHDRLRLTNAHGRHIDKFIIGTLSGRQEVYFDITETLKVGDDSVVKELYDLVDAKFGYLEITLPKPSFMIMFKLIEDIGATAFSEYSEFNEARTSVLMAARQADIENDPEINCCLSAAQWVRIYSMINLARSTDLQQEYINDLRSQLEGALKQAAQRTNLDSGGSARSDIS